MPSQFRYRLLELIVHLIHRLCIRIFCRRYNFALFYRRLSDPAPVICIVRDGFCNNIFCPCNGVRRIFDSFFIRNILLCRLLQRFLCILQHDISRQRLQSLLLCDRGTRSPFRAVRTVQILHRHLCLRRQDLLLQLFRQLSLLLNTGDNLLLLLFKITEVHQALIELSELLVIQRTCNLFSVSRNKRNRVPFIDQFYSSVNLPALYR